MCVAAETVTLSFRPFLRRRIPLLVDEVRGPPLIMTYCGGRGGGYLYNVVVVAPNRNR